MAAASTSFRPADLARKVIAPGGPEEVAGGLWKLLERAAGE